MLFFVITKVNPVVESVTERDYRYGNLYDFSKVNRFKIALPERIEHPLKTLAGTPQFFIFIENTSREVLSLWAIKMPPGTQNCPLEHKYHAKGAKVVEWAQTS